MDEQQLEATLHHLIHRREAAKEGSAAYNAAVREIRRFLDAHPEGEHIAEELNSNLGTDVWSD